MKIDQADCRTWLKQLLTIVRPHLLFADPPFNMGQQYEGFNDRTDSHEFSSFMSQWIRAAWSAVASGGVLAIHHPVFLQSVVWRACRLFDHHHENTIIWHYRFGQCRDTDWIDNHCQCAIFRKPAGPRRWNPDAVLVESDRKSKYGDSRIQLSSRGGMRVPGNVWGIPSDGEYWGRVQGNSKERRSGHPNQLPEVYLERLIRAYTDEGDFVVDPFVGSGTTPVVARALGRRFRGCDISKTNVEWARERMRIGSVRIPRATRLISLASGS
jgi:site-specific DNA-methyltransferase (adenine-specific)